MDIRRIELDELQVVEESMQLDSSQVGLGCGVFCYGLFCGAGCLVLICGL